MKSGRQKIQLNKTKSLLIVCGEAEVKLFTTQGNTPVLRNSFGIPLAEKAEEAPRGKDLSSYVLGCMTDKFKKKLNKHIKDITADTQISAVYMFAPEGVIGFLLDSLQEQICNKVRMCVYGDHGQDPPQVLIEKINDVFTESVADTSLSRTETDQILRKCLATGSCEVPARKTKDGKRLKLKLANIRLQ
jgi:hypothetical protein